MRPPPLQTTRVHQDILNHIFHDNSGLQKRGLRQTRLTLATFTLYEKKLLQGLEKGDCDPVWSQSPFQLSYARAAKGRKQGAQEALRRGEPAQAAALAASALCAGLSIPSFPD